MSNGKTPPPPPNYPGTASNPMPSGTYGSGGKETNTSTSTTDQKA